MSGIGLGVGISTAQGMVSRIRTAQGRVSRHRTAQGRVFYNPTVTLFHSQILLTSLDIQRLPLSSYDQLLHMHSHPSLA